MHDLIDSHSHLDVEDFDQDRDAVVQRARDSGVARQVVPAIAQSGWNRLGSICRQYSGLYPAYGLHPIYLPQHQPSHLDELDHIIEREQPVAVGECGLDHHIEGLDPSSQLDYFEAQLKLAGKRDLPLIIHARQALAGGVTVAVDAGPDLEPAYLGDGGRLRALPGQALQTGQGIGTLHTHHG